MPRKVHSKKQSRKLWALASRGEISQRTVHEMHEGVSVKRLPERHRPRRSKRGS